MAGIDPFIQQQLADAQQAQQRFVADAAAVQALQAIDRAARGQR